MVFRWGTLEVVRGACASLVLIFEAVVQDRGEGVFSRVAVNNASGSQHCGEFQSAILTQNSCCTKMLNVRVLCSQLMLGRAS